MKEEKIKNGAEIKYKTKYIKREFIFQVNIPAAETAGRFCFSLSLDLFLFRVLYFLWRFHPCGRDHREFIASVIKNVQ